MVSPPNAEKIGTRLSTTTNLQILKKCVIRKPSGKRGKSRYAYTECKGGSQKAKC
jgi:hypothetical protein